MTDYLEYSPDTSGRPPLGLFVRTETSSSHNSFIPMTPSIDSVGLGSFHGGAVRNAKYEQLEQLINFISIMPDYGKDGFDDAIKELSELVQSIILTLKDPSLKLMLRSFGWNGKRFQTMEKLFEREKLLQAVSNVYLKFQYLNITSLESLIEGEGIHHIEKIAAFAPDLIVEYLKQRPTTLISNSLTPPSFQISGACMLIDISGFSKFSAAMCLKGAEGLDELRKTTSGMLGRLVKAVYEYEGDVIAFAGDALICVFQEFSHGDLDDLLLNGMKSTDPCYRAIYCAELLRDFKFFDLSTHIGISQGNMTIAFLGGFHGAWTYLLNGPCISQLSSCIEDAAPHHVVVTKECYIHIRTINALEHRNVGKDYPDVEMTSIGIHGNYHFENIIDNKGISMVSKNFEKSIRTPLKKEISEGSTRSSPIEINTFLSPSNKPANQKLAHLPPRPSVEYGQMQMSGGGAKLGGKRGSVRNLSFPFSSLQAMSMSMDLRQPSAESDNDVNSQLIDSLSTFVPRPVMVALYAEANHQIGELRTVTTLFMSLDTYDPLEHSDPATLQPFFLIAQKVLSETGGYLRQFLIDDKGCVLIIMWGMPLHTFSNNSSRALYTAYNIKVRAEAIGHQCSIGITTGNVFCGTIGASERLDYVGIGNEVNLAARFMSKAKHRILVDESTYANLNEDNRPLLQRGDPLVLKGMSHPISPYIYIAEVSPVLNLIDTRASSGSKLLKKKIMQELEKQLDKLGSVMASHITPHDIRPRHNHQRSNGRPVSVTRRRDSIDTKPFTSNTSFTVLSGPAGSGKRTAAEYFLISARERGLQTIQLTPKSHQHNIPYGVMKDLMVELIGEEKFNQPETLQRYMHSLLDEAFPDDPDNRALANITISTMLGYSDRSSSGRSNSNNLSDIRLSVYGEMADDDLGSADDEEMFSPLKRSKQVVREGCDLSFYRLLTVLLRGRPTAIVIENAQFCDELSWNELYLMLAGYELNASILLTIKSKPEAARRTISPHASDHNFASPLFSANSTSISSSWIVPTAELQTMQETTDVVLEEMEKMGLEEYQNTMFTSIFSHPKCKIVEMKSLTEDEVRTLLMQTLKIDSVSSELLRLVMDASSGNTYWVKNIANLIKDLGVNEIERKISAGSSGSSTLKTLIHCRLDLLDAEARRIVKLACVAGFEFTPKLLESVVIGTKKSLVANRDSLSSAVSSSVIDDDLHTTRNSDVLNSTTRNRLNSSNQSTSSNTNVNTVVSPRYSSTNGSTSADLTIRKSESGATKRPLSQILEELEKSGFIYCAMEIPTVVYSFQNELLQKTLYEMIMPSDAAGIHLLVANFIEEEYQDNLRPFYPSLAVHYRQSNEKNKAFKYEIKAAALAITSGAFRDGLVHAESAFEFLQSLPQVNVLLEVIERAECALDTFTSPSILKSLSSSYASFMFRRDNSSNANAINLLKGDGDEQNQPAMPPEKVLQEEKELLDALEASKPFAERRIATEQNTLRHFNRLRNRVDVLKAHIEEGLVSAAEENPDRQSLQHGQDALLKGLSGRKLSWQPSFNANVDSTRPISVERSPVHRQQTITEERLPEAPVVTTNKSGCHCIIS